MAQTHTSFQADGITQTFTTVGKVPYHTVIQTFDMAAGTGHVTIAAHTQITGVIENLLAAQHRIFQFFVGYHRDIGNLCRRKADRCQHILQIKHTDRAAGEVINKGALTLSIDIHALRRQTTLIQRTTHCTAVGIDNFNGVRALQRHQHVIPLR